MDVPERGAERELRDEILLRPYLEYLWRKRLPILLWIAGLTGLTLLGAYLVPAQYRCTAVVITPTATTVTMGQALAGTASPLSILHGIGDSAATYNAIGKQVGLKPQDMRNSLDFEETGVYSQLTIAGTARTKAKAERIVRLALEQMRKTSAGLSLTMGEQQVRQLERVVQDREAAVARAQDEFARFQKGLVTAPDPANPLAATAYGSRLQQVELELGRVREALRLARRTASDPRFQNAEVPTGIPDRDRYRDQIVNLEYSLRVAQVRGGPRDPEVVRLTRELAVAKETFRSEVAKYSQAVAGSIEAKVADLSAQEVALGWQQEYLARLKAAAPDEAVAFARRQGEIQSLARSRDDARKQLDDARLSSQVYRFVWTVLQEPTIETVPVNKKYGLIGGLAFFASLIIVVGAYCIRYGVQARRQW